MYQTRFEVTIKHYNYFCCTAWLGTEGKAAVGGCLGVVINRILPCAICTAAMMPTGADTTTVEDGDDEMNEVLCLMVFLTLMMMNDWS